MRLIDRRGAIGIGASALLVGCASPGTDRLTWWAIGQTGENAPLLIPPFERTTGIGVDVQALPATGAHEKLLTAYAGNSLPDVMMIKNDWLAEMALIGALAPVPAGSPLLTGQFRSTLAAVKPHGTAIAAPWVVDSWVQFYRRDLLAEAGYQQPPADWAEWTRMAEAIKRGHPDRFATLHLLDWPEPLMALAAQTGEPLLRDRSAYGNFAAPGFRAALGFYKSIYDQRFSPAILGAEAGDTLIAFRRGRYAILPADAETARDLHRPSVAIAADRWSAAPTPGPTGAARAIANGYSLAVGAHVRNPARAWQLVEYLCRPQTQLRMYDLVGSLPASATAWRAPIFTQDPVAAVFGAQVASAAAPPSVPEWERIVSEVQLVAEQMVRGRFGVDAAAAEMNRRVDAILAKRRWLLDRGAVQ